MIRPLILALALFVPAPSPASAETLTGHPSVIDGDTLEIHGTRIRLHGIDAPESSQTCKAQGESFRCGQKAAFALADRIGNSTVSCEGNEQDRHRLRIARRGGPGGGG